MSSLNNSPREPPGLDKAGDAPSTTHTANPLGKSTTQDRIHHLITTPTALGAHPPHVSDDLLTEDKHRVPVEPDHERLLRTRVKALLQVTDEGWPGSQPILFQPEHFSLLENEDYFVSQKSVGDRFLMLVINEDKKSSVFLIDPNFRCYFVPELHVHIPTTSLSSSSSSSSKPYRETLLDGELVVERDRDRLRRRFLIFDAMAISSVIITHRSYSSRLGMLNQEVLRPYSEQLKRDPALAKRQPFTLEIKRAERSYGVRIIFSDISHHRYQCDGLIFSPVKYKYVPGLSPKLLKWYPPELATADFKIRVTYSKDRKPVYKLMAHHNGMHRVFSSLQLDSTTYSQWRNVPPDGRIGEFRYDPQWKVTIVEEGYAPLTQQGGWRFVRFRPDRTIATDESELRKLMGRLKDCISRQTFETHVDKIRAKWKHRERVGPSSSSSHGPSAIKEESGSEIVRLKSPSLPEGSPHHQRRSSGSFPPSERKGSVKPEGPCSGSQTSRQTSPEKPPGSDTKGNHPPSSHFVSPTNRHSTGMDTKPSVSDMTPPSNASRASPVRRSGTTLTPLPGSTSGKRKFGESDSPLTSPTITSSTNIPTHRILSQSPNGNRDAGKMPKLTSDIRSPRWDHRPSGFSDSPSTKHSNDGNNNNSNSNTLEKSPSFTLRSPKDVSPQHMRKGSSADGRLHLPRAHTISTKLSSVPPTDTSPFAVNRGSSITSTQSDNSQVDLPVSHAMGRPHTTDSSPNGQLSSMLSNGVVSPNIRSSVRGRGRGRGRGSRVTASNRTVSREKDPSLVSSPKPLGAPSSQPTGEPTTTTASSATSVKVAVPPPALRLPPKPMSSPPLSQFAPSGSSSSASPVVTQETESNTWPQSESLNRDLNQSKETALPSDVLKSTVTLEKMTSARPTPCPEPTSTPMDTSPHMPNRMAEWSGMPKNADNKSAGLALPSTGVSSEPSTAALTSMLPTTVTSQPPSSEGVTVGRGSNMGVSTILATQVSPRPAPPPTHSPPGEPPGSAVVFHSSASMVSYPQYPMTSMPPGMMVSAPMRPHILVTNDHPRPMGMSPQMPPAQRRPSFSVSGAPGGPQPPPPGALPPHSMSPGTAHPPFPPGNHPMMYTSGAGGPPVYHQHGRPPPGYGRLPPGYPHSHPHPHAPPPHKARPHPPPSIHTAQFSPPGSRRGSVSHSQVSFSPHNAYSPSPALQNHPSFVPNSASPHPYGAIPPTGSRPSPQSLTVAQFPTLPPHDPAVRMGRPPGPPHSPASAVPPHMLPRRGSGPVSTGVLGGGPRPQAPPAPNRSFSIGGPSPLQPLGHPPPNPSPRPPPPYSRKTSISTVPPPGAYPPGMLANQMRPGGNMIGGVPPQPLPTHSQSMQTHGDVPFPPGYQEAAGSLPPSARGPQAPPPPPRPHPQSQYQYQPHPQLTMANTMGGRVHPGSSPYRSPISLAPPSTSTPVMEPREAAAEKDRSKVTDAPTKNKSALDFIMNTSEESGSGKEPQDNSYMSWFN